MIFNIFSKNKTQHLQVCITRTMVRDIYGRPYYIKYEVPVSRNYTEVFEYFYIYGSRKNNLCFYRIKHNGKYVQEGVIKPKSKKHPYNKFGVIVNGELLYGYKYINGVLKLGYKPETETMTTLIDRFYAESTKVTNLVGVLKKFTVKWFIVEPKNGKRVDRGFVIKYYHNKHLTVCYKSLDKLMKFCINKGNKYENI